MCTCTTRILGNEYKNQYANMILRVIGMKALNLHIRSVWVPHFQLSCTQEGSSHSIWLNHSWSCHWLQSRHLRLGQPTVCIYRIQPAATNDNDNHDELEQLGYPTIECAVCIEAHLMVVLRVLCHAETTDIPHSTFCMSHIIKQEIYPYPRPKHNVSPALLIQERTK